MRSFLGYGVLVSLALVPAVFAEVPPELGDAEARWKASMQKFRIPGMAVAVVRDGQTVFAVGLGKRGPDTDAPVTPETVFYAGSVSRTLLSTAAMLLAEGGKLELDAPVKKYLPNFRIADASLSKKLTVRDLLTQSKGLSNAWVGFRGNYGGELDAASFDRLLPKTRAAGAFRDDSLHALLLGRVVEAATGGTWKELVQSRLVTPAKMTRTFLSAKEMYGAADSAVPVEDIDGVFYASRFPKTEGTMHAGGGMGSSAADLGRWVLLNLAGGGAVAPESVLKAMHVPQITLNSQLFLIWRESYGLGWYVGSYGGKRLVHELGGSVGARSHVSFMPNENVGVVVLLNLGGVQGLFADAVACDVYERLLKLGGEDPFAKLGEFLQKNVRASKTAMASSRARPAEGAGLSLPVAAYLGRYVHDDWGTLGVTQQDGELHLALGEFRLGPRTAGVDHFEFDMAGGVRHGQFLLGPNRTVIAAELQLDLRHHSFTKR